MEIIDPRYRSLNFPPKSKRNWKRTPREERRNRSFNRETKKIFGCRAFIYISFWSKWLAFPEKPRTRIEIQGASSLKDTNSTRWNQLELRSLATNYTLKRHRVMKSKGRGGRDTCKRIQNLIQNNRFGRKFGLFRVEFFIQNTKFLLETANS